MEFAPFKKLRTFGIFRAIQNLIRLIIIEKGQTILTGTPAGVVYNKPSTIYKIRKGTKWIFTLSFLNNSVVDYLFEEYIQESLESKVYLQSGDRVQIEATWLGQMNLTVTARS